MWRIMTFLLLEESAIYMAEMTILYGTLEEIAEELKERSETVCRGFTGGFSISDVNKYLKAAENGDESGIAQFDREVNEFYTDDYDRLCEGKDLESVVSHFNFHINDWTEQAKDIATGYDGLCYLFDYYTSYGWTRSDWTMVRGFKDEDVDWNEVIGDLFSIIDYGSVDDSKYFKTEE